MSDIGIVQTVFNAISLERNPKIWQSEQDGCLKKRRIEFLSEFPESGFTGWLKRKRSTLEKNVALCEAFKDKGNGCFKNGNYQQALGLYNQAVCLAADKKVYAVLLGNRSAVWFALKDYDNSIGDIDLAIHEGYPPTLRHKVIERKIKCLINTGRNTEAEALIEQDLTQALAESGLDPSVIASKVSTLRDHVKTPPPSLTPPPPTPPIASLPSTNPSHPRFSASVSVRHTPSQGRFTVAARDIAPGEVIAVDEPAVKFLDRAFTKTNCWECFARTKRIVPCEGCSGVVFCGVECRVKARRYHRYECTLTDVLYQGEIGAWILAHRVVTAGLNEEANKDFFDLVTHDDSSEFCAPGLMKESLTAVFLVRCLQTKGFFGNDDLGKPFGEKEMAAALTIHKAMRIARFNSHELSQVQTEGDSLALRIGISVNPTLALINHSCDSNYGRVWNGKSIIGFATRTIRKGEEIVDSYSGTFDQSPLDSRELVHQRYLFTCQCRACQQQWPVANSLPKSIRGNAARNYRKETKNRDKLIRTIEELQKADTLPGTIEMVQLLEKLLLPPHGCLIEAERRLHHKLLRTFGEDHP